MDYDLVASNDVIGMRDSETILTSPGIVYSGRCILISIVILFLTPASGAAVPED